MVPILPARGKARDRRDIVTPYAFEIDRRLIGLPLAAPRARALAIAVDGVLVALLSTVPGEWLAIAAGIVAFHWAGTSDHPRVARRRSRARIAALLLVAAGAVAFAVAQLRPPDGGDARDPTTRLVTGAHSLGSTARLALLPLQVERGICVTLDCVRGPVLEFAEGAAAQGTTPAQAWDVVADLIEDAKFSEAERDSLRTALEERMRDAARAPAAAATLPDPVDDEASRTSLLAWARGLLDDLGIGLGWAALYFSVFPAWWNGQTPGKRLLGIRVVQLDGTPLTLWDAFERYGGYGAGFATGLLGFLQVAWDMNRQAIHDKICQTVVIDGDLPREQAAAGPPPPAG